MNPQPKLVVNEIFGPTIQGEGKSSGKRVLFLRLSGCNLACVWCDTPYTWNWCGTPYAHPDKYNPRIEQHPMPIDDVYQAILDRDVENCKALVISGGEPTLQQRNLIPLIKRLKEEGWWIEVETNGTNVVTDEFLQLVDQINCSAKLASSGPDNSLAKRRKVEALRKLAESEKTYFKFVVVTGDDLKEVHELIETFSIKRIYLMPEGRTKHEQELRMAQVKALCQKYGFDFSPRLHVLKWGTQRGV